jgi:hypothetical protein
MNNISSPRTDDTGIEHAIIAKGLTAPRVTPSDITANISSVHFFTAREGCEGAHATGGQVYHESLGRLTFCVIVLKNGFTVTGESACVSPENFDITIGQQVAKANAIDKIWPLMGYALAERLQRA